MTLNKKSTVGGNLAWYAVLPFLQCLCVQRYNIFKFCQYVNKKKDFIFKNICAIQ